MGFKKSILYLSLSFMISCAQDNADKPENTSHGKQAQAEAVVHSVSLVEYKVNALDLNAYTKSMKRSTMDSNSFFLLPLDGCDKCVAEAIKALYEHSEDVKQHHVQVIIGGNVETNSAKFAHLTDLMTQYDVVLDSNLNMFKYDIHVYGPTLIMPVKDELIAYSFNYENFESGQFLPLLHR